MPRKEEYVKGMVLQRQRNILAVMKDAPTKLSREEFVPGTVQRSRNIHVVTKDVLTLSRKEEYVEGMERTR